MCVSANRGKLTNRTVQEFPRNFIICFRPFGFYDMVNARTIGGLGLFGWCSFGLLPDNVKDLFNLSLLASPIELVFFW